jgi:hypothetical protein
MSIQETISIPLSHAHYSPLVMKRTQEALRQILPEETFKQIFPTDGSSPQPTILLTSVSKGQLVAVKIDEQIVAQFLFEAGTKKVFNVHEIINGEEFLTTSVAIKPAQNIKAAIKAHSRHAWDLGINFVPEKRFHLSQSLQLTRFVKGQLKEYNLGNFFHVRVEEITPNKVVISYCAEEYKDQELYSANKKTLVFSESSENKQEKLVFSNISEKWNQILCEEVLLSQALAGSRFSLFFDAVEAFFKRLDGTVSGDFFAKIQEMQKNASELLQRANEASRVSDTASAESLEKILSELEGISRGISELLTNAQLIKVPCPGQVQPISPPAGPASSSQPAEKLAPVGIDPGKAGKQDTQILKADVLKSLEEIRSTISRLLTEASPGVIGPVQPQQEGGPAGPASSSQPPAETILPAGRSDAVKAGNSSAPISKSKLSPAEIIGLIFTFLNMLSSAVGAYRNILGLVKDTLQALLPLLFHVVDTVLHVITVFGMVVAGLRLLQGLLCTVIGIRNFYLAYNEYQAAKNADDPDAQQIAKKKMIGAVVTILEGVLWIVIASLCLAFPQIALGVGVVGIAVALLQFALFYGLFSLDSIISIVIANKIQSCIDHHYSNYVKNILDNEGLDPAQMTEATKRWLRRFLIVTPEEEAKLRKKLQKQHGEKPLLASEVQARIKQKLAKKRFDLQRTLGVSPEQLQMIIDSPNPIEQAIACFKTTTGQQSASKFLAGLCLAVNFSGLMTDIPFVAGMAGASDAQVSQITQYTTLGLGSAPWGIVNDACWVAVNEFYIPFGNSFCPFTKFFQTFGLEDHEWTIWGKRKRENELQDLKKKREVQEQTEQELAHLQEVSGATSSSTSWSIRNIWEKLFPKNRAGGYQPVPATSPPPEAVIAS